MNLSTTSTSQNQWTDLSSSKPHFNQEELQQLQQLHQSYDDNKGIYTHHHQVVGGLPAEQQQFNNNIKQELAISTSKQPFMNNSQNNKSSMNSQQQQQQQQQINNGPWTDKEHARFLEALKTYSKGQWKQISCFVGTRTPNQTRTHGRKYYEKLERWKRGLFRKSSNKQNIIDGLQNEQRRENLRNNKNEGGCRIEPLVMTDETEFLATHPSSCTTTQSILNDLTGEELGTDMEYCAKWLFDQVIPETQMDAFLLQEDNHRYTTTTTNSTTLGQTEMSSINDFVLEFIIP